MGIVERKTRQKQALRERILDAARDIVMREGFAALSMRKIADAIEYSPATLYLHFDSRDEIARALCEEGYAQLLASFVPLEAIADPAERLRALGRAYVHFGMAHPQTYRLIFMEDPSYTKAALGHRGGAASSASGEGASNEEARVAPESGDLAIRIMIDALDALRASGALSVARTADVYAEALWATLHGIVALKLTCPVFPSTSLDTIVDASLDVWFGAKAQADTKPAASGKAAKATGASLEPTPAAKRKRAGA